MTERVFTQTFGVVAGILERDGKILLMREAGKSQGVDQGKWNHPAGWIDVGEDPIDAVKREVKEETGFSFTPKNILGVYSLVRKDLEKERGSSPHPIKLVFTGEIPENPEGELESDSSETRWFTPEEIYEMDSDTLRDLDIKTVVKDYFEGKNFPLELIKHTVSL